MATSEVILDDDKREAMRQVLVERGQPLDVDEHDRERYPGYPALWVNTFGWEDYNALQHLQKCSLIIPKGVTVSELDFSQFAGTDNDNDEVHGIMAYGGPEGEATEIHCACGHLHGMTIFYQGTFSDLLLATLAKLGGEVPVNPRHGFTL